MRIKLSIKPKYPGQIIPINYQYHISSFIYHTIEASDSNFSEWLHNKGVRLGNKRFKFFTFSQLYIPSREIIKTENRIKINSETIDLIISMMIDDTAENFIIGMFERQKMKIYDEQSEAEFYIKTAELLPEPKFENVMKFKTISPIVLTTRGVYKGKEAVIFLNPEEERYFDFLKRNIEEKYIAWCQFTNTSIHEYKLDEFEVTGNVKAKLVTIKEGKDDETKIKGYVYNFILKGDTEFIRFAYRAGIGKWNSLGFGCIASA
jgi:CRISPR-associated endoribonuclease Cas6